MALLVQKYGGTSVADPDQIRAVADYVARARRRGDDVVVVVSAMGKETDELMHLAEQVSDSRPARELDMLITVGERKTMALLCMALADLDCPAASFTGSQAGMITDTGHTRAKLVEVNPDRVKQAVAEGKVAVVGGAQGMSTERDVTFLGRNASDLTGVALAHALGADACEIYTDVSGIFTADPRMVSTARKLKLLSFDELLEMTASGCPKPQMRAVEFARNHKVPLHIRSSFTWEPGTWAKEENEVLEQAVVSAVVHDTSEAKVTVTHVPDRPGVAARLFRSLADAHVNVDTIVQNVSLTGTTDISFTVPRADLARGVEVCQSHADELGAAAVLTDDKIAKVSLIGAGMKSNPGIAASMFETLAGKDINIEMITTSPIRITCVIEAADVEKAVAALHDAFELEE